MKKSFLTLMLTAIISVMALIPANATAETSAIPNEHQLPRLVDDADLLDSSEEDALLAVLDEISVRQSFDVVVVTVNSTNGKTPMAFADDYYNYNGYGFGSDRDGALLLLSMEERDYWVSTTGFGITALTDAGIKYISDKFLPALSGGNYADAFNTFATQCDAFVTQAKTAEPYDIGRLPSDTSYEYEDDYEDYELDYSDPSLWGALLINPPQLLLALVIGFIIALIVVLVMRSKLKSVRSVSNAAGYIRQDSFKLTASNDLFLYHTVSRTARETESSSRGGSSTHTGSSGTTHGGGGGKF